MEILETVLVTGGTGAVGANCILQLLQKGYNVKTTLRSKSKINDVQQLLKNGGITAFENLAFVEADLTTDANWDLAMKGCTYVLHVASPTHIESDKEEELVRPAVEGTLRVLKAARDAGVKRVVMTSSFGALGFSNKDQKRTTTEADWTDVREKGLSVYEKSKGLAERAAWKFISDDGGDLELVTINPVAIFGPVLGPVNSPSLGILKMLLSGSMKAIPKIPLNIVDIRDVADLHIRAMVNPAAGGQRFIATADGEISMPEIAILLKNAMPEKATNVSIKTIPNWLLYLSALFNSQAKKAAYLLKISRNVSNDKAKKLLGWKPVASNEEAILASLESMTKFNLL
jgi:nucleoside-diphosphate-sugar epimerase